MKTIPWKLLLFILLISGACSKPKENTNEASDSTSTSQEAETKSEESVAGSGKIQLKGIYVTSTQIPASKYGYSALFDDNTETYWATMPGAGPDEGIMLYFQSPQSISHIDLVQPGNKNLSAIEYVSIYVNGSEFKETAVYRGKFELNATDVQSLFIRINKVVNMSQEGDETFIINTFPDDASVGISEIKLYSNNTSVPIGLPSVVTGTMSASSTLEPSISYGIRNLFDSRKEFVWVEGAKGNGENESLTFKFSDEQEITGLKVMNGFQRSDKHFTANGRVKGLVVSNERNETSDVTLTSEQGEQTLQLSKPINGKELTLKVKEIYPGTSYKDLVISELKFMNKQGEFIMADNITEKIKQDLIAKSKNTVLEKILDKRVSNEYHEMDSYVRSIILRSDYTFVAYSDESTEVSSGTTNNEIIADGNWEIKELGPDQAKIRIFGKLIRLSESTDYYQGNSSDSYLQIFQDNLTIKKDNIVGEKFIQELKLATNESEN